jgi:hypothetical protein
LRLIFAAVFFDVREVFLVEEFFEDERGFDSFVRLVEDVFLTGCFGFVLRKSRKLSCAAILVEKIKIKKVNSQIK